MIAKGTALQRSAAAHIDGEPEIPDDPADDSDGDATNGILVFDLTQAEAEIVNNESNVTVSYHTTLEDAEMDANEDVLSLVIDSCHFRDRYTYPYWPRICACRLI